MKKLLVTAVALLASAAGAMVSGNASAAVVRTTHVQDVATGYCLNNFLDRGMYKVRAESCAGDVYQQWKHDQVGSNFRFINKSTNACLNSSTTGTIYGLACNDSDQQLWTVNVEGGWYQLRNLATGRCLDSNFAGEVYSQDCNGGDYQHWRW